MKITKLILVLLALTLADCVWCKKSTAIVVPELAAYHPIAEREPLVEFLGIKDLSKYDFLLNKFGEELAENNLVINSQNKYLGDFDLRDLSYYVSNQRYVAFLEVVKQWYRHSDAVADNIPMYQAAWGVAGATAFLLFPVYVPLFCCYSGNECEFSLNGDYNLYIYDTQSKEVIMCEPIAIHLLERKEGQYSCKHTDRTAVNLYYKTYLRNELLKHFESVVNRL